MLHHYPAAGRGHTRLDWLDSRHSFSFGEHRDPARMGFSTLRVINEDVVAPGGGFPTHGHRDMEIVTYVLEGTLSHRDSLGNGSEIRPGDVQRMSAGSGIRHSEYNHSPEAPVHLLQVWLLPSSTGEPPGYAQDRFPPEGRRGRLRLLVSPDGRDGSLDSRQNGLLYGALLGPGDSASLDLAPGRRGYVHVARGRVRVNGEPLGPGDALGLEGEPRVRLEAEAEADVLVFDLP
jgi:hypothetical protein